MKAEYETGIYIAITLYIGAMAIAGFGAYAFERRRRSAASEDVLANHYLGGRSFGPFVTAATIFASLFSGYTIVGIPNEAFRDGWAAVWWIPQMGAAAAVGYMGTGPRLRSASLVRNHFSPTDFITDRYGSQVLRYTFFVLQLFPALIYLSAQYVAVTKTANSILNLAPSNPLPVLVAATLILGLEWMGGLASVAWTDAVQGFVMCAPLPLSASPHTHAHPCPNSIPTPQAQNRPRIVCSLLIPLVLTSAYGGWGAIDPMEYPRPTFYQVPSPNEQWLRLNFVWRSIGFFTLPHMMQRTYAAKTMGALKLGYAVMAVGPWITQLTGVFVGTLGVWILRNNQTPADPFTAIVEKAMEVSTFGYLVGLLAFTGSLAAIMSTADSLLLAISQLFTAELVSPLCPKASPRSMANLGKLVSLGATVFSVLVSLFLSEGLDAFVRVQFQVSLQAVPIMVAGLYCTRKTEIHPWALAAGAWAGVAGTVLLTFLQDEQSGFLLDPGVTAAVANFGVAAAIEMGMRCKLLLASGSWEPPAVRVPHWDVPSLARFGASRLTPELLWATMRGVREPLIERWFLPLMLALSVFTLPLGSAGTPALTPDGALSTMPAVTGGIPDWVLKCLITSSAMTVVLLSAIRTLPDRLNCGEGKVLPTSEDSGSTADRSTFAADRSTCDKADDRTTNRTTGKVDSEKLLIARRDSSSANAICNIDVGIQLST